MNVWDERQPRNVSAGRMDVAVRRGSDRSRALVLLHSIGMDLEMWEQVVTRLQLDCDVVGVTLRGHLDCQAESFSVSRCVDDLTDLISGAGYSGIVLVGLSLGGAVAQELAVRGVVPLTSLVLIATSTRYPTDGATSESADRVPGIVHDAAGGWAIDTRELLDRWFTTEFAAQQQAATDYVLRRLGKWPPPALAEIWRALGRRRPVGPFLGQVGVPTLCIAGSEDRSTPPARLAQIAAEIPGARLVEMEGPHLIPLEQPARLANVLAEEVALVSGL